MDKENVIKLLKDLSFAAISCKSIKNEDFSVHFSYIYDIIINIIILYTCNYNKSKIDKLFNKIFWIINYINIKDQEFIDLKNKLNDIYKK